MQGKLSRKGIKESLDQVPLEQLFSPSVSRELTHKQKTFAREVAKGATKADAYRKAYKADAAPTTIVSEPYSVARNPLVSREIEAYKLALQAAEYSSPAALRALVIQSLVQVVIDPEAKHATKVAAAKVLGTVTEVAAFTERKQVTTITHSADAKAQVLDQLRALMRSQAVDAVEVDADSLLAELTGAAPNSSPADPHPPATPLEPHAESLHILHTTPHKQSPDFHDSLEQSFDFPNPMHNPSNRDDPPSSSESK